MREGGRKKKEKGREMRWGWLRFFSGATTIFLIFQARKEKNGAKPTASLHLNATTRTTNDESQGKARHEVREGNERGGSGPDQTGAESIIWQKGMEPNDTTGRQGKARQGKGKPR